MYIDCMCNKSVSNYCLVYYRYIAELFSVISAYMHVYTTSCYAVPIVDCGTRIKAAITCYCCSLSVHFRMPVGPSTQVDMLGSVFVDTTDTVCLYQAITEH